MAGSRGQVRLRGLGPGCPGDGKPIAPGRPCPGPAGSGRPGRLQLGAGDAAKSIPNPPRGPAGRAGPDPAAALPKPRGAAPQPFRQRPPPARLCGPPVRPRGARYRPEAGGAADPQAARAVRPPATCAGSTSRRRRPALSSPPRRTRRGTCGPAFLCGPTPSAFGPRSTASPKSRCRYPSA